MHDRLVYRRRDGSPTGNGFVEPWRVLLYPNDSTDRANITAFMTWQRWTTPRGPLMLLAPVLGDCDACRRSVCQDQATTVSTDGSTLATHAT